MENTALPTVVYYVAASLDGFIATPEGGLDWLTCYDQDPEVAQDFPAFEQTIDSIVMGSKTYAFLLKHGTWPHPGKPDGEDHWSPLLGGDVDPHHRDH